MIFETIADIIATKMDIDKGLIKPESTLEDLKIDSLDMVEILMDIEEALDVVLDDVTGVKTIGELCDFVNAKKG